MLKWQKWPKWLKWHCKTLNVHNFVNNRDIEVGFSLFDFYGLKLSVEMVYNGFGGLWVFSHFWSMFQQQLSLASINGVVCHCLRVIWAPSTWSPRLHPITVHSGSHLGPAPTTLKSAFETSTDIHIVHIRPVIQAVPTWNLLGEGFSKYSYKLAQLVPRC